MPLPPLPPVPGSKKGEAPNQAAAQRASLVLPAAPSMPSLHIPSRATPLSRPSAGPGPAWLPSHDRAWGHPALTSPLCSLLSAPSPGGSSRRPDVLDQGLSHASALWHASKCAEYGPPEIPLPPSDLCKYFQMLMDSTRPQPGEAHRTGPCVSGKLAARGYCLAPGFCLGLGPWLDLGSLELGASLPSQSLLAWVTADLLQAAITKGPSWLLHY